MRASPSTATSGSDRNPELAAWLRTNSSVFCEAIANSLQLMPKWVSEVENFAGTRQEFVELHFAVFGQYAAIYFASGATDYRHLFLGELIKALYVQEASTAEADETCAKVLSTMRQNVLTALDGKTTDRARADLDSFLEGLATSLRPAASHMQRILFIGDCLYLDIVPFLHAALMECAIRLVPDYATSKNPLILRDQLKDFSKTPFDLVFFSPVTYEFSPEFNQILNWRSVFEARERIVAITEETWTNTRDTLDVIADLFDCPIHVHNASAIIREENSAKRLIKSLVSRSTRSSAKHRLNRLLNDYLATKNSESIPHLFLFDENRLVSELGELTAGAHYYKSALQHPAKLGKFIAPRYTNLVYVNSHLLKRKVVVCDLDNTLWDGVIGEGAVSHFHDRQNLLKSLKSKGVLLAICSKNEPAKVHWRDGTLTDEDFVCAAISWEPKIHGMRQIQDNLNLKIKDFVFIDDRHDERELMELTYPGILCLDATDPTAWARLADWSRALDDDSDMDRTQLYKQREARKAFIQDDVSSPVERAELFNKLGLRLSIKYAQSSDLKRVSELINRTNQFNLEGTRTTFREVNEWHRSAQHRIVLGQTSDRFGGMGTTCIAVAEIRKHDMRILLFVLSCRVFGYGIETGVMNHLKRIAKTLGVGQILGNYSATPQNAPCRNFLADHGFVHTDGKWTFNIKESPILADPSWLTIAAPAIDRSVP